MARDGRAAFYRVGGAMMRAAFDTVTGAVYGEPERVFDNAQYQPEFDVDQQGRFLVIKDRRPLRPPRPIGRTAKL